MNDKILKEYTGFVCGRHSKHNTRRVYLNNPKVMLKLIGKPLEDITQKDVNKYAEHCYKHRKQNTNAVSFWSNNQFLKWVKRKDLKLPKIGQIDAGKLALNVDDTQKLLDTVENLSPLHRLVFYLEYDAIRRPDEIRTLKKTARYGDELQYDGKTDSKTGKKIAYLSERLVQAWVDYVKNVRPLPATPKDNEFLILGEYGQFRGKRLETTTTITRMIKEISMYAKIKIPDGGKPTNYLIKRTSITRQLKQCRDPKIIQFQAGHSKLSTTMKYNRINESDIRNYLRTFEDKSTLINEKREYAKTKNINQ